MKLRRFNTFAIAVALVISMPGCGRAAVAITDQAGRQAADHENATVSYLGPEGTCTQEACGVFFGGKGTYIPYETVSEAVDALEAGDSDYTVIPQENTIGGAVTDYVDTVISHEDLYVIGEVELPINQNLLVVPGAELGDIRTVFSHKQGIAQGKEWLGKNLPGAEIVEVSSTAEGARMIAESGDKSCAAIASAACVDVYGLEMLASAIQENDSNKTRFYVLSKELPASAGTQRTALVASGLAGDLPLLLEEIQKQNMTLISIHDRPMKTELGEYQYILECTGGDYRIYQKLAEKSRMQLRYLGSFDVY